MAFFRLPEELILEVGKYLQDQSLLSFAMTSKRAHRITAPLLEDGKGELVRVWSSKEEGVHVVHSVTSVRVSRDRLPKFWSKYKELFMACEASDVEQVKALLADERVIHVLNDEKLPKVHEYMFGLLEAVGGSIEIVKLLDDADVDLVNLDVVEFAYLAAAGKLDEDRFTEQLLLLTGEDSLLDLTDEETARNALYYALMFRAPPAVIERLLNHGLSFHTLDIDGVGPLQCAFTFGQCDNNETEQEHLEYLRSLLPKPELQGPIDPTGCSAVHYAVLGNHAAGLDLLLAELGADVDAPAGNGVTPLCLAIAQEVPGPRFEDPLEPGCKIEIIQTLLEAGASVTTEMQIGGPDKTPLDLALTADHPCLRLVVDAWLLEAGYQTEPDALLVAAAKLGDLELMERVWPFCGSTGSALVRYDPERAILDAARNKNASCVTFLLGRLGKLGGQYTVPEFMGATALEFALSCPDSTDGDIRELVYTTIPFIIRAQTLLEAIRHRGPSIVTLVCRAMHPPHREEALRHKALVLAAELGKPKSCRALLKHMDFANLSHRTALQAAIIASLPPRSRRSRLPVVELLMKQADLLDPKSVNTAALKAAKFDHSEVLRYIIATHGDVIHDSHPGILEASAGQGYIDIIDPLYAQRPELKAPDMPCSPSGLLIQAACAGQKNMVKHLIRKHGADLNHVDDRGRTALHYAAAGCCPKVVKLLLRLGLDPGALDGEGRTPFVLAATLRARQFKSVGDPISDFEDFLIRMQLQTMRVLLENGANVDDGSYLGKTVLSHCVEDGQKELVQFLVDNNVNIFAKNADGTTALECAKSDEIIRILYGR
ncbi:ankyrin repeat-containing domain protein [Aspergillus carlsbadensis]|nr:ankyrin repeat-containing domain protein [Aspergillus carlsbadensis]